MRILFALHATYPSPPDCIVLICLKIQTTSKHKALPQRVILNCACIACALRYWAV